MNKKSSGNFIINFNCLPRIWCGIFTAFFCFGVHADNLAGVKHLGKGYVTYNKQLLPGSAINPSEIVYSSHTSSLNLSILESKDEVEKDFGVKASAEIPVKMVHIKSALKLLREHTENEHTSSFFYRVKNTYKFSAFPKGGGAYQLLPDAEALAGDNPETFVSTYGNAFITGVEAGAAIYFLVKVHFSNIKAKTQFSEEFGASQKAIGSIATSIQATLAKTESEGHLSIHGLQLGGSPGGLLTLLSGYDASNEEEHTDSRSTGSFTHTQQLSEAYNAQSLLTKAIEYAGKLSEQIDPDNAETLFPFGTPETTPYKSLDQRLLSEDSEVMNTETIEARKTIMDRHTELQAADRYEIPFYTLARLPDYLETPEKNTLERLKKYYDDLADFFEENDKLTGCYTAGRENASCLDAVDQLNKLKPTDYSALQEKVKQLNFMVIINGTKTMLPVSFEKENTQQFARPPHIRAKHRKYEVAIANIKMATSTQDEKQTMYERSNTIKIIKYVCFGTLGRWLRARRTGMRRYTVGNIRANTFKRKSQYPSLYTAEGHSRLRTAEGLDQYLTECLEWQKRHAIESLEWQKRHAIESRGIINLPGHTVSFHDSLYFPQMTGHVYVHAPIGAGFCWKILNSATHESITHAVSKEVQKKGLQVSIGDIVIVGPLMSRESDRKAYIITEPYDDKGKKNGMDKLPINGVISVSGTLLSPGYHLNKVNGSTSAN